MPRRGWSGRRVTAAIQWIHRNHPPCWLCHHPIHPPARSLDHELPASTHPHLEWTPSNWRPAHLNGAGTPKGCHTPGCHCPGNTGRKTNPHTAPPTRNW